MRLFVLAFVGGTLALQHAAELPEPRLALTSSAADDNPGRRFLIAIDVLDSSAARPE